MTDPKAVPPQRITIVEGPGPDLKRPASPNQIRRTDVQHRAPPSKPVPAQVLPARPPRPPVRVLTDLKRAATAQPRTPNLATIANSRFAPEHIQQQWRRNPEPPWHPQPPIHPDPEHPIVVAMREIHARHARKG
jgi:hypothetical protein